MHITWRLCAAMLVALAWGVTQAQQIIYTFGPAPGEFVAWPEVVDLFSGEPVVLDPPTVVFVQSLSPCAMCEVPIGVARRWLERYDNVQVILVTRDTGDLEAVRAELADLAKHLTVVADDGRIAESLGFNSQPNIYVISEDRQVRFRQTGFSPRRLIGLNEVVGLADEGRWREIDGLVARSGGKLPEAWVSHHGGATIIMIHSDDCIHCQRLADQGMALILNDFARRHPNATFVILSEADALAYDRHLEMLIATYGAWIGEVYAREAQNAPVMTRAALADAQFENNVMLVEFVPGDPDADPMYQFGVNLVPNILVFDEDGWYQGPKPYWLGPYDAGGLISILQSVLP